jgi:hypothetical protein
MNKKLKIALIAALAVMLGFALHRVVFIRTVYYEIGGIKIPSKYNALTGSVRPLADYTGKPIRLTIADRKSENIGLSKEQVAMAQFRWSIFEQWANSRTQYRGWQDNPDIFKMANEAFRKEVEAHGPRFRIVK